MQPEVDDDILNFLKDDSDSPKSSNPSQPPLPAPQGMQEMLKRADEERERKLKHKIIKQNSKLQQQNTSFKHVFVVDGAYFKLGIHELKKKFETTTKLNKFDKRALGRFLAML